MPAGEATGGASWTLLSVAALALAGVGVGKGGGGGGGSSGSDSVNKVAKPDGVVDVVISSASGEQNNTLNLDDIVYVTVSMSDAVTVVGTPQLKLDIGGNTVLANYAAGSGTSSLIFIYAIEAGLNDPNGISIDAGALLLNGGALLDASGMPLTNLTHYAVRNNSTFLVDTTAPDLEIKSYNVNENTTAVATLLGTDESTISFSLGDASDVETALFNITPKGVLTLKAGADFESFANTSPAHAYRVKVDMVDAAGNIAHQTITVEVNNVNEAPVFSSNGHVSFAENTTGNVYQPRVHDVDASTTLVYELSGTDANLFNIDINTGALTFKTTPNFEVPVDADKNNIYNVILQCSDGEFSAAQEAEITVTDVSQLKFNYNFVSDFSKEAQAGFEKAAAFWSSLFSDEIQINLNLDYKSTEFSPGTIGYSQSSQVQVSYSEFHEALASDATTSKDNIALNSLSQGSSFGMLINLTKNNPNGDGSTTAYLDDNANANNNNIQLTRSNAKAVGLLSSDSAISDATIAFNSTFAFDFDRSDGIDSRKTDFVGVAIHEIGHVLGFVSGLDFLDIYPGQLDWQYPFVSPLDLFRYSEASAKVGVIDFTASNEKKYFSLNRGETNIALFSTGVNYGDGRQASHWKDGLGLGGMDPTLNWGEFLEITNLDLMSLDVIGWDPIGTGRNISASQIASNLTTYPMLAGDLPSNSYGVYNANSIF
jgi:hypothetical protein